MLVAEDISSADKGSPTNQKHHPSARESAGRWWYCSSGSLLGGHGGPGMAFGTLGISGISKGFTGFGAP